MEFPGFILRFIEYAGLFGLLAGVPVLITVLSGSRRPAGYFAVMGLLLTSGFAIWRELLQPPPPPPPAPPPAIVLKKLGPVEEPPPPPPPPPEPEPEPPPPEPSKPVPVKKCANEVMVSRLDPGTRRLNVTACGADAKKARETVIAEAFGNGQRGARRDDFHRFPAGWRAAVTDAVSDTVKEISEKTSPRGVTIEAYIALDEFTQQLRAIGFAGKEIRPSFRIDNAGILGSVTPSEMEQVILDRLKRQSRYAVSGGFYADSKLIRDEVRNLDVLHKQVRYILDVTDLVPLRASEEAEEHLYVIRVQLGASD